MYDLGLTSEQFWELTMAELGALTDRWAKRNEAEMYRTAYLASVLINIHRNPKKRPIRPEELLASGSAPSIERLPTSVDEVRTVFATLSKQSKQS